MQAAYQEPAGEEVRAESFHGLVLGIQDELRQLGKKPARYGGHPEAKPNHVPCAAGNKLLIRRTGQTIQKCLRSGASHENLRNTQCAHS